MKRNLVGVMAVSIAALLIAGCGRSGDSSTQPNGKPTQTTAKQSLPIGFTSVEDLLDDFKEICDYASDLEDTVSSFERKLNAADIRSLRISIPSRPFLNYRGILCY